MSSGAVGNAAGASIAGTVYQLFVALQKCWEMEAGQSVFIERYGDVTLSGSHQIEVKHYDGNLTDSHLNFWKTLGNWMRHEFDEKKYSALVLLTTQPIGPESKLIGWNAADLAKRLELLQEILHDAEERHAKRVAAHGTKTPALSVPESLQIQRRLLSTEVAGKLREVASRTSIASGNPDLEGLHAKIKQVFCKGVLVGKQDDVCAALLIYIVNPAGINNQGWEIGYDAFTEKCTVLFSQYCKETRRFPSKYRQFSYSPDPSIPAKRFVQNIRDISYDEVVVQAVKDYLYASNTVAMDFAAYERPPENYQIFSDAVLQQFSPQYALAKRTLATQLDGAKTFYDQMVSMHVPPFPGFDTPDASFRNGVLHMHHDDEEKKLSWKLT